MLKLVTLIILFFCFVYSNNEHNVENQTSSELQLPKEQNDENKNSVQTIKGQYVEEKEIRKPCKVNKNRRFGDKDKKDQDLFESLPLTATLEQTDTASIGNKIITSSIHGANYNIENNEMKTDNSYLDSKNCDCNNCVSESKKVLEFESLALNTNSSPLIQLKTGEPESEDSNSTPSDKETLDEPMLSDANNIPLGNVPLNINTDEHTRPCSKEFKTNTRRKNCQRFDLSENLPTTPSTRRILPGIIESPTKEDLENNKLYQDSPQSLNNNNEMELERRHNNFPKGQKVNNNYDIDLVNNMNINEEPQQDMSIPTDDSIESQLIEPTRGKGIYDMKDAGVMLLENSRVCYACSTMSDPTCWSPNRRTTVKYCRKGHQSCLTKSFKHKGKSVIIRDCGSYCVNIPGEGRYSSCSICHSDLCNGAPLMSIYGTGIVTVVLIGILMNTH